METWFHEIMAFDEKAEFALYGGKSGSADRRRRADSLKASSSPSIPTPLLDRRSSGADRLSDRAAIRLIP
jgi:hypothetical protein